jgi:hypothetical protein
MRCNGAVGDGRSAVAQRGLLTAALLAALASTAQAAGAPAAQGSGAATSAAPAASVAVPPLADGHPDLNGTWDNGSGIDFLHPQKLAGGSVCVAGCESAPPANAQAPRRERPPANFPKYRPEYLAKVRSLNEHQLQTDPVLHCRSPGLPRIGPPDKIVQTGSQVVFLYDDVSGSFWRIVPTDGRPHREDVDDSTLGDSVGHWEGDTLVIDVTRFNDDSWLTDNGAFHTAAMHVTERLRRTGDSLHWEATVEDPKVLSEPWKATSRIAKLTDVDLVEPTPCVDRDIAHVVDKTHHDNPR